MTQVEELSVFLSFSNVDILQINKSKLHSTVHNDEVYIPGFEIVRKDRKVNGRHGGGLRTYLRTNLNYRIRNDLMISLMISWSVYLSKLVSHGVHHLWSVHGIDPQVRH